ncbi:CAP domain-containing protein [Streptomyces sp. WM6378]|uniref:CAP domain-containing protein n=1 Tax=Streptomyces sp. WM6378 TaxID=1415557 RepID=UPI0006AF42E2|nr:CAP domain-containing protein [Streptomyces sp. WM6378]KOU38395.1 stress protein [Streptomyces sp. WM6378]
MAELVPGGNQPLPDGVLKISVPGPFDLSLLITDDTGQVSGDTDFVFYNQPSAPGTRLDANVITLEPARLRPGASRVTVVVSPAEAGTVLGRLPAPVMSLTSGSGAICARFTPPKPVHETVLLLAEIYRRGTAWKVRALGQGYADGLAGIARDFGVDISDDAPEPATGRDALTGDFTALVNAERARSGVPPVAPDARLTAAAQAHASAMAGQGRLSVESPDGASVYQRVTAQGFAYLTIAEHLVSGPRTPTDFLAYCLSSPATRRPVLDPALTSAGIARSSDDRGGDAYWTALWARPLTPDGLARTASEVVALTNAERAAAGLRPLAADPGLSSVAQAYSADMATRGFYSHTSPEGLAPWDRARAAGCTHRGIGENIACGQRTAAEVVQGWMNSPGHRANILKTDFSHIGVGYAGGGRAGTYWTQLFGLAP